MTTPSVISTAECVEPQLLSRADLVGRGVSEYRLRRALAAGELIVVSPGVYARDVFAAADPVTAHRVAIRAVLVGRGGWATPAGQTAVSHFSAAVLHRVPLPGELPGTVHVTRAPPAKSRAGVRLTVHRRTLDPGDLVQVTGLLATSVPRTLIDCLLMVDPAEAVGLVVAVLRSGRVEEWELRDQLSRNRRVPGMRAAAAAVRAVTGLAVTGLAVTGSAVTGSAVTGSAVTGLAATGMW